MYKKHFFVILLAHLVTPISLLLPILRVEETRIGYGGKMSIETSYTNIFGYASNDVYLTIGIFIIVLSFITFAAIAMDIIAMNKKEYTLIYAKLSFFLTLSIAMMGAMSVGVGSYLFSAICVLSFVISSVLLIRVIKRVM
ncbi:MAG: hypothetical protein J6B60_02000 [Clostridia bacterium]|nr:hypothetical protein [Clostridia bacterium]